MLIRTVRFLCGLAFMMAWSLYGCLRPVLEWLWRKLSLPRRCISRMLRPIIWYASWKPEKRGGRDEPQIGEEVGQLSETGSPKGLEESGQREGRPEAAAEERPEDSNRGWSGREEDEDTFDSEEYRVEPTDELYCDYDSTWEDDEPRQRSVNRTRRPAASRYYKFSRFETAAKDMQNYRHDYPLNPQYRINPGFHDKPNLNFYLGKMPSMPDGVYIDDFHQDWARDYDKLEYVHSYIQWLFPLQEPGMNYEASTLTKEEIKEFLESTTAKENLLKSYKLMLDFYGIELCSERTGKVQRASNWKERFQNLNSHTHNSLRITRILKCQGTLGLTHYQTPLVHFFLEETLVNGQLPNIKESALSYFLFAVLDKRERKRLLKFAYFHYDFKDEFVWCPKKIQMIWSKSISDNRMGWRN